MISRFLNYGAFRLDKYDIEAILAVKFGGTWIVGRDPADFKIGFTYLESPECEIHNRKLDKISTKHEAYDAVIHIGQDLSRRGSTDEDGFNL
jgi:hypothetical protein